MLRYLLPSVIVADIASTLYAIGGLGAIEANPIWRNSLALGCAVNLALALMFLVAYKHFVWDNKTVKGFWWAVTGWRLLILGNNIVMIMIML